MDTGCDDSFSFTDVSIYSLSTGLLGVSVVPPRSVPIPREQPATDSLAETEWL